MFINGVLVWTVIADEGSNLAKFRQVSVQYLPTVHSAQRLGDAYWIAQD
jgi:hypothetical protein